MKHWLVKISDETFRTDLGRRFESVTDEAFSVVRWTLMVGLARYLSVQGTSIWLDVIHWVMSLMLFGYLASRFLLRPEIPIFANRDTFWKRIAQTVLNYALCMAAFMAVMWGLNHLVAAIADYRLGTFSG